jgi:nucleotide-binding universal stress UspA family protein
MRRSIVVGVDGTADSITALRRAAEIARTSNLLLVVVHVRHSSAWAGMSALSAGYAAQTMDEIEADAHQATDEALRKIAVDWEFVVRAGEPAHELIEVAEERSALYIVVGGRPHSAPASVLLGSVATAVVHHFQGSVLVVRSNDDSEWIASEHARDRWQRERAIDAIYGETISTN